MQSLAPAQDSDPPGGCAGGGSVASWVKGLWACPQLSVPLFLWQSHMGGIAVSAPKCSNTGEKSEQPGQGGGLPGGMSLGNRTASSHGSIWGSLRKILKVV